MHCVVRHAPGCPEGSVAEGHQGLEATGAVSKGGSGASGKQCRAEQTQEKGSSWLARSWALYDQSSCQTGSVDDIHAFHMLFLVQVSFICAAVT